MSELATFDALFEPFSHAGRPGASLLVMHAGNVIRSCYGLADVEQRTPVVLNTNFRLASLSKAFTAASVMLLVRDRTLSVDDRLTDLLPAFPAYGAEIRLRHLLSHTSGIPDYEDFVPDDSPDQVSDAAVLELMCARTTSPLFPPGAAFRYSNTAYALIALIVERYSGQRYADVLSDRVFAPLGMRATVAFEPGRSRVEQRAFGYTVTQATVLRTDQNATSAVLGDGGIYSSVVDMERWIRALTTNALLTAEEWSTMTTPAALNDGRRIGVGFGWFMDEFLGRRRLRHHGESVGFTNAIQLFPDDDAAILILTNRSDAAPWKTAERIATTLLRPT